MSDRRITSHINCEKRIAELEATQQLCIVYKEKMLFESDVVALLEELEADIARHIATALDTNEALWKVEADREAQRGTIESQTNIITRLHAELASLKGRRCETCNEFPHYFICKRDHNPTRWDTFSCSEWAARAEEGGEERAP